MTVRDGVAVKDAGRDELAISSYEDLLIFFDRAKIERNEQKAIIQRIKQRWSRQQFGERTPDKKQVNVMLSTNVITLLDELAKTHDLKRGSFLERLITAEAKAGKYLTEIGKPLT